MTIHISIVGALVVTVIGSALGGFAKGFVGAFGRDVGALVRRRKRTITLTADTVTFPPDLTADEMQVLAAAVARGTRIARGGPAMIDGQMVPAFIAALMGEGVTPEQIGHAVAAVRGAKPGQSLAALAESSPLPRAVAPDRELVRAFIFEQARRLED